MRGWLILSCGLDGTVQSRFSAYLETIFEWFGYSSGSQISDSGSLNLSTGRCQRKFYLYRFLSMEILYFPNCTKQFATMYFGFTTYISGKRKDLSILGPENESLRHT